jgi:hypothetical protein
LVLAGVGLTMLPPGTLFGIALIVIAMRMSRKKKEDM